jgi:hypothetical protein
LAVFINDHPELQRDYMTDLMHRSFVELEAAEQYAKIVERIQPGTASAKAASVQFERMKHETLEGPDGY